jgi:endo-1,3-1,4-beta-glycanase ExoK
MSGVNPIYSIPQTTPTVVKPAVDEGLEGPSTKWEKADGRANAAPFNAGWHADNISFADGIMTLQLDKQECPQTCSTRPYASGEYRSTERYSYGLFQTRFQAARGDGLVSSFFTYTGEEDKPATHHEIDIEILGKDPTKLQTNYFTAGAGDHEMVIDLGFDASQGQHDYAILWAPDSISWYVDGKLVHSEDGSAGPLPTEPGQIMVNLWPGVGSDHWLNHFNYTGPVQARYDYIRFTPFADLKLPAAPPAAITSQPTLPPGFTSEPISPAKLVEANKTKIRQSAGRAAKNIERITAATRRGDKGAVEQFSIPTFSEFVIQWLVNRENGTPSDALLGKNQAAGYRAYASPYWQTKVALVIAAGEPSEDQLAFLQQLNFAKGVKLPLDRAKRLTLTQEIYDGYLNHRLLGEEGKDPLILGEMKYQLALLESRPDKRQALFDEALTNFNRVSKNEKNEIRKTIIRRSPDAGGATIKEELAYSLGKANVLKAQLLLFRAGQALTPTASTGLLLQAYDALTKAVPHLSKNGLYYLQIKQLAAECLVRVGFFLKDQGTIAGLSPEEAEILKGLTANFPTHTGFFRAARALLESVAAWETDYKQAVPVEANHPQWLKQISSFSRLWQVNIRMVEIGEDQRGTPKDYKARQLDALAKLTPDIKQLLAGKALDQEAAAQVQRVLAENLARQGFIQFDLGLTEQGALLFQEAKQWLAAASKDGTPAVKAEAALWQAKIALASVGAVKTATERQQILSGGLAAIGQALATENGRYLLTSTTLSSALQTQGDLLSASNRFAEADKSFGQAIDYFAGNTAAHAARGDALNWQRNFAAAEKEYNLVLKKHPSDLAARLGLAEIAMRRGSDSRAVEDTATRIFKTEAPGSYLITRALDDLIEAYSANEDLNGRVIVLANALLGTKIDPDCLPEKPEERQKELAARAALTARLQPLVSNARLSSRFTAKLYLKMAQVVSWTKLLNAKNNVWDKRFAEAQELLTEAMMPKGVAAAIKTDDELALQRELLQAEITMRRQHKAAPILNEALWQKVMASKEPDLISSLILDRAEGYAYEEDFGKIVALSRQYITPAAPFEGPQFGEVRAAFKAKRSDLDFNKFKFQLWQRLADALSWNKDYVAAAAELGKIFEALKAPDLPKDFTRGVTSVAQLALGNIYTYDGKLQDFGAARAQYRLALYPAVAPQNLETLDAAALVDDMDNHSKKDNLVLAWALFGLGQIARYGTGSLRNYDQAKKLYTAARAVADHLPQQSDERNLLLARINLGESKLEKDLGQHPAQAARLLHDAYTSLALVEDKPANVVSEFNNAHLSIDGRIMPTITAKETVISGRDHRTETSRVVGVEVPLVDWLHATASGQIDSGSSGELYSAYFGARAYFDPFTFGVEVKPFKPGGSAAELPLTRRHDLRLTGAYSSPYFSADAFYGHQFDNPSLDSYFAEASVNLFGRSDSSLLQGLGFPYFNYNHFNFAFAGNIKERDAYGAGAQWAIPVTDWLKVTPKVVGQLLRTPAAPVDQQYLPGLEFGVDAQISIGKYLTFQLCYSRQQNSQYPMDYFCAGLGVQF